MRALVTGATGFVGSHLVDRLLASGSSVSALVRDPAKAGSLARQGVRLIVGDLSDRAALVKACAGQDVIYHLAGAIAAHHEAEFMAVNRDGAARLAEAAEAASVRRFLLVSSLAAGGPSEPNRPLVGTEPPHPVTSYGRSKLAGESVVRASNLDWTIVRAPAVYGPKDRELLRVFRAAALGIAPVLGGGSQQLSLVFGPDLAAALIEAGTSAATSRGVLYASHPERLTSRQLVETIGAAIGKRLLVIPIPAPLGRAMLVLTEAAARLTGRPTVLSRDKGNELFQAAWLCDSSRLTELTGWRAEHDLAVGARLTFEWYRREKWL